ncbi:uncharacterized protein K452DRAFT_317914 [Aplosporella prunicola CBS 121167]|uniref:Uncharacterized protein n=1 Tax=Aplosporella prunicola CBS 121167 TaxID=1176127 RepID=A0A6A6BG41_9PEZI|nr:uncharacterized protein K452DRAFT_317914 [Aplosporella prunicola CBS 121167]KAF2143036.1 hypothetical protein K452DRAFT_317914 [Aplosporella prunicola CBS 121167]
MPVWPETWSQCRFHNAKHNPDHHHQQQQQQQQQQQHNEQRRPARSLPAQPAAANANREGKEEARRLEAEEAQYEADMRAAIEASLREVAPAAAAASPTGPSLPATIAGSDSNADDGFSADDIRAAIAASLCTAAAETESLSCGRAAPAPTTTTTITITTSIANADADAEELDLFLNGAYVRGNFFASDNTTAANLASARSSNQARTAGAEALLLSMDVRGGDEGEEGEEEQEERNGWWRRYLRRVAEFDEEMFVLFGTPISWHRTEELLQAYRW